MLHSWQINYVSAVQILIIFPKSMMESTTCALEYRETSGN